RRGGEGVPRTRRDPGPGVRGARRGDPRGAQRTRRRRRGEPRDGGGGVPERSRLSAVTTAAHESHAPEPGSAGRRCAGVAGATGTGPLAARLAPLQAEPAGGG